jgi:uncharacterized protein with PIN domain
MLDAAQIRFVADRMLGRLARMLRLLGYDTEYSPQMTTPQLREIARRGERVVLTRGQAEKRFAGFQNVFSVKSENAPQQLREVVERFGLDPRQGLWTRCTLCNGPIETVAKAEIEQQVKPKVYQLYAEFFRCAGCGHVYWRGSHVDRILKNLDSLLGSAPQ